MTTPNVSPVSVEKLLPCAHCGGSDLTGPIFSQHFDYPSHSYFWVECRDCPAKMKMCTDTRAVIVSAWNRRASTELKVPAGYKLVPLEPTEEMLEALRDGIDENPCTIRKNKNHNDDRLYEVVIDATSESSSALFRSCSEIEATQFFNELVDKHIVRGIINAAPTVQVDHE